jgi:hypothetical protein
MEPSEEKAIAKTGRTEKRSTFASNRQAIGGPKLPPPEALAARGSREARRSEAGDDG